MSMSKKLPKRCQIRIKGQTWTIYLCTDGQYPKSWEPSHASTVFNSNLTCREIYIKRRYLNYSTVVHELTHAYLRYGSYKDNKRLLFRTAEEYFAQFMEQHARRVTLQASKLLKKLRAA